MKAYQENNRHRQLNEYTYDAKKRCSHEKLAIYKNKGGGNLGKSCYQDG